MASFLSNVVAQFTNGGEAKDQFWKVVAIVVGAVAVGANFVQQEQQSTFMMIFAALAGYLLLSTMQTNDIIPARTETRTSVGRSLKATKASSKKGRGEVLQKLQPESSAQDDSTDDSEDSEDEGVAKQMLMKFARNGQRKSLTNKVQSTRKKRQHSATSSSGVSAAEQKQTKGIATATGERRVLQLSEQVAKPSDSHTSEGSVAASLDDAMRGVTKFIELEKRSRAIDRLAQSAPPGLGNQMPRSPHSHAAKVHAQQTMVDVLKWIHEVRRLQQCRDEPPPQEIEHQQAGSLLQPFLPNAVGCDAKELVSPIVTSPPPGLEPDPLPISSLWSQSIDRSLAIKTKLSATARPFAPGMMLEIPFAG